MHYSDRVTNVVTKTVPKKLKGVACDDCVESKELPSELEYAGNDEADYGTVYFCCICGKSFSGNS